MRGTSDEGYAQGFADALAVKSGDAQAELRRLELFAMMDRVFKMQRPKGPISLRWLDHYASGYDAVLMLFLPPFEGPSR